MLPVIFEGQVKAVLELASFEIFSATHQAFLEQLTESIGIVLNTIEANMLTEGLLKQSQSLAAELQSRQEELQNTNQELQEKAQLLAHQNAEVERKNFEVEQARQALEEKATQLALTSKYKSEFLANMSHELRTPLNSLLILSDQLSKNPDGNLTAKQTDFAKTIHSSGNDLLMLINDILDLSKIESGTVVLDVGDLQFEDLRDYVERTFRHVAESKAVDFFIHLDSQLPKTLLTDSKRLQQVIKNLLSNAFKFTHQGHVSLAIQPSQGGWGEDNESLSRAASVIAVSVSDTGIGISADKQQIIFEAFQQADGSTSRKYGGTGLGLAISREIARLLGGEIRLQSTPGKGSSFTLYLPQTFAPLKASRKTQLLPDLAARPQTVSAEQPVFREEPAINESSLLLNELGDDRDDIRPSDRVLLIVDNDLNFARLLVDVAHDQGFKAVATSLGAAALALTKEYNPAAITLDICLPDIDGWSVLNRLKNDLETRHVPVCVISTEEEIQRGPQLGAVSTVLKPITTKETLEATVKRIHRLTSRTNHRVLAIEPDAARARQIADVVGGNALELLTVGTPDEVDAALASGEWDCIIYNPGSPGLGVARLAEQLNRNPLLEEVPLLIYASAPLTEEDRELLAALARRRPVAEAWSAERLLDQVVLRLGRPIARLSAEQRRRLEDLHSSDKVLAGKKVLLVDDDIRNIFALTSVLERHNMVILSAETGRDAIRILQSEPDIDIVLMDIMMPEMDGVATMQEIRRFPKFKSLPMVAVTAKAMKGDREKCIEAGAWDYLSKPIDSEQMLSVLRAWLYR